MARRELIRELVLRALRKRRPWRVSGGSMEPDFRHGDLVLIDDHAVPAVDDVIIARHPFKNLDVIKYLGAIDDDGFVQVRSPAGDDTRQFGRIPVHTIKGVVTINVTATWRQR